MAVISALCGALAAGAGAAEDAIDMDSTQALQPQDTQPLHLLITPLYREHNELATETGSSTYVISSQSIDNLPQGNSTALNNVLLQAPGVAQDSYGQLHIRGDHADLQYRINGIILPEGITGFGQALDTHFAEKIDLLTGALPAQYGYRTAGIVDITTQSGNFANGGESSVMVGSDHTFQGNQEFYGSSGGANYFFTGNYLSNDRGLEPPTGSYHTTHDDTTQDKEFGYLSYALSPESKLSVIFANSTNRFEIPNNPGQPQGFNFTGAPALDSSSLDERQFEHNIYAIAALQGNIGTAVDYQLAYFTRDSTVLFKPDPIGDLEFNGITSRDYRESFTNGLQNDFNDRLSASHTLRAGWSASYEQATSNTSSSVFQGFYDPTLQQVVQTGTTPFTILDNSYHIATLLGAYLQDEWHPVDNLTINYGARVDTYSAFVNETALCPRIGAIYDLTEQTRLHAGYARYFTPPPTELITPLTVQQFLATTGATPTTGDSPVKPEKDNYFDAGVIQKVGKHLTLGVDTYYKQAHDLLDEGQFGQALIFSPFNYDKGWVKGMEFTADYSRGSFTGYVNLALSKAMGKDVVSGQYNFTQDELYYIQSNAVHLDHDQLISGSLGAAYAFHDIKYSTDMLFGSGLRDGFANTNHLPFYTQVNLGAEHAFDLASAAGALNAKFSVINLFDHVYEIRDGTGIGVFAPQYGPRRGVFMELSKGF